jgi:tRNA(Ile)-lysidine synthase
MKPGRTHPPTLVTLVKRALVDDIELAPRTHVLCATSGGPDSMALLDVLATLRRKLRFSLSAHGVDHGLRQEAGAELELAARWAEQQGVPFGTTRVAVAPGSNLQARARQARYAALRKAAKRAGATLIATAHHADDRAETLLIRLLHGASVDALAVLPPRDGDLVRPMIRASRSDVMSHLARHRIPFARDPSNEDPRFLRVRVRAELMPTLTELDPGIVSHLCALADEVAQPRGSVPRDGEPVYGISRATRLALARLAREPEGSRRTVLLPGGIQATKAVRRTVRPNTKKRK